LSDFDDIQEDDLDIDTDDIPDDIDDILDDIDDEDIEIVAVDECGVERSEEEEEGEEEDEAGKLRAEMEEARDEYLRLYAEFENFKKRTAKDKVELAKYANESILTELLTSFDNLEIALKHADQESTNKNFLDGVQMTLRELYRTFEKFGVTPIKSEGQPFDPEFHHAVAHLERDDMDENMVVVELRKGFMYNDKVLRASMVSVSKKPSGDVASLEQAPEDEESIDENNSMEEQGG